eukprot:701840-Prorocentrum_minimum.AAC.5
MAPRRRNAFQRIEDEEAVRGAREEDLLPSESSTLPPLRVATKTVRTEAFDRPKESNSPLIFGLKRVSGCVDRQDEEEEEEEEEERMTSLPKSSFPRRDEAFRPPAHERAHSVAVVRHHRAPSQATRDLEAQLAGTPTTTVQLDHDLETTITRLTNTSPASTSPAEPSPLARPGLVGGPKGCSPLAVAPQLGGAFRAAGTKIVVKGDPSAGAGSSAGGANKGAGESNKPGAEVGNKGEKQVERAAAVTPAATTSGVTAAAGASTADGGSPAGGAPAGGGGAAREAEAAEGAEAKAAAAEGAEAKAAAAPTATTSGVTPPAVSTADGGAPAGEAPVEGGGAARKAQAAEGAAAAAADSKKAEGVTGANAEAEEAEKTSLGEEWSTGCRDRDISIKVLKGELQQQAAW